MKEEIMVDFNRIRDIFNTSQEGLPDLIGGGMGEEELAKLPQRVEALIDRVSQ